MALTHPRGTSWIVAGCMIACITSACHQPEQLPFNYPATQVETLQVGAAVRRYDLHVPPPRRGAVQPAMPLVIVLHGTSGTGRDMESSTGFSELADREGFLVAYPYALGDPSNWDLGRDTIGNQSSDTAFIRLLLDSLSKRFPVDPRRIFVAGHSNGGMMAYVAGSTLSDRIAAIGVSSGTAGHVTDDGMEFRVPRRHQAVSAIIFHGTDDPTVPYDGVQNLNGTTLHLMSAPQSAAFWARSDACLPIPRVRTVDVGAARVTTYRGCRDGTSVVFYTIAHGTHRWPGGSSGFLSFFNRIRHDVPATELMWEFWKAHPKAMNPTMVATEPPPSRTSSPATSPAPSKPTP